MHYPVANMTGANRLLIGLGWAAVALTACARDGTDALEIPRHHRLEMRFLLAATLYSFLIPLDGTLGLIDAAVLLLIFLAYVAAASRGQQHEVELVGPAAWIDARTGTRSRRTVVLLLLGYAAFAIIVSAEPFAHGLVELGRESAIDEFILIQWVPRSPPRAPSSWWR